MQNNHLLEPISCLLDITPTPLSEYELITQLQKQGWLEKIEPNDPLSLYSTHFLVYNALFQLHDEYQKINQQLYISALNIQLIAADSHANSQVDSLQRAEHDQSHLGELRSYYLDWNNLKEASRESVESLINGFWERFVGDGELQQAVDILGLSKERGNIKIQAVKQAYRKLAMQHHPDRGGDAERFTRINWAFGVLQRVL